MQKRNQNNQYDKDYYGWVLSQSELLKKKEYAKVDWKNVLEEIEGLGRSEKRALRSSLRVYLMHMLKAEYQPEMHTRSWDLSLKNSLKEINITLKENPSLKPKLKQIIKEAYDFARTDAAQETRLPEKTFPKECPWDFKDLLK